MIGNRLIFGQQNLSNRTNDLKIYNDENQYHNSGLIIGNDNQDNLRLSFNTSELKGKISVNKLNIDSQYISIPNILPSRLSNEQFKNLVIDSSGNLAIGDPQYIGDINQTIDTINSNINTIDNTLINLQNQINTNTTNDISSNNMEMLWIYGLCILLFLLIAFVIYQIIFNINQQHIILSMKRELDKFRITPEEKGFEQSLYGKTEQNSEPQITVEQQLSTLGKKKLYDYIINKI